MLYYKLSKKTINPVLPLVLLAILLISTAGGAFGQHVGTDPNSGEKATMRDYIQLTNSISEVSYAKKLIGSRYVYDDWMEANIFLTGDTLEIEDVLVRFDVQSHDLEVKFKDERRLFPFYMVDHVILKYTGETFYTNNGLRNAYLPRGFYKVLYDGAHALYSHYSTSIKEANYNPALDAGRRDDQLLQVENQYVVVDGEIFPLERKRSARLEQLNAAHLAGWIKKEKIDLKQLSGLIMVLQKLDDETN